MNVKQYCKWTRENVLKMSLKELADRNHVKYHNLWQFENGINDMFYNIYYYFNQLDSTEAKKIFKKGIWEALAWE